MDSLRDTLDSALSANYRIERELGGGGMSRVFLAEEVALKRQVVIKALPPDLAASLSADRFRREIQMAAQLQHPHVVPVHAAGAAAGTLYYVMPFVEGQSLRERLSRGALAPADAVRIWREVLDALSYAHGQGVVHRDIKPENILLSGRHALVTDFGVAHAMRAATGEARVTATGTVLGTPAYMAPEQAAADRDVDHRADIYAAGLVMYEMLSGESPFHGLSPREMLIAHVTRDAPSLAERQPLVPAPLAALVMKCLAKDRGDRPPNADAVLAELDRVVTPTTLSPAAGVLPVRSRRTALWTGAAIVVVAAVAAWGARTGRLGFGPPKPPAHDSLRLRVVTASLQYDPADSTLARRVRDAALAELEKEPWLFVITPSAVRQTAVFTGLSVSATEIPDTIRKYAKRSRTHAIVDFGVSRAGSGYVLSVQAHSAASDSSLDVISEAASGAAEMPGAMTRLGARLRAQLVSARATLPPTKATSFLGGEGSGEAVELLTEAQSEFSRRNWLEGARRARAAAAADSMFVDAWLLTYYALVNAGVNARGRLDALSRAYALRDRIRAPLMRMEVAATYWNARGDNARAMLHYDSLTRLLPASAGGWNNLGLIYATQRKYDLAIRTFRRSIDTSYKYFSVSNLNLVTNLLRAERVAEARAEVARMNRADSLDGYVIGVKYWLAAGLRDWREHERLGAARLAAAKGGGDRIQALSWLRGAAANTGKIRSFDTLARQRSLEYKANGSNGDYVNAELQRARLLALLTDDTARARAVVDSALHDSPWESVDPLDRPWAAMLDFAAAIRDTRRSEDVAREWSRLMPAEYKMRDSLTVLRGRGEGALASGNAREALRLFRLSDVEGCAPCFFPLYARAFDALGQKDSAKFYLERYANSHYPNAPLDAAELAHAYLRLGELSEDRRDPKAAITWYEKFTSLWAESDTPVLQAKVSEVKTRLARLRRAGG